MNETQSTRILDMDDVISSARPPERENITSTRFSLLDLAGSISQAPLIPARVVPELPSLPISAEGRERAIRDVRAAEYAGFALRPPIYPIGTEVIDVGADNFRASRLAYESLPQVSAAADALIATVRAEKRHDVEARISDLRMVPDGQLAVWTESDQLVAPMMRRAFDSFVSSAMGLRGRDYLRMCPSDLRALNVNYWLDEMRTSPRRAVLRTREGRCGREIWATVGTGYSAFDADRIAAAVSGAATSFDPQARAQALYNPDGSQIRLDVLWHSDIVPEHAVAGEIFQAGVRVRSADDGTRGIVIEAEVHRNLCRNLLIVDVGTVRESSIRHRGDDLETRLVTAFARALRRIEHFRDAWSDAGSENVLDRYDLTEVRDVFRGLYRSGAVTMPDLSEDTAVERLYAAWSEEPGYTKSAIINAITRCAQGAWGDWEQADVMEREAGRLLFTKVWTLPQA